EQPLNRPSSSEASSAECFSDRERVPGVLPSRLQGTKGGGRATNHEFGGEQYPSVDVVGLLERGDEQAHGRAAEFVLGLSNGGQSGGDQIGEVDVGVA